MSRAVQLACPDCGGPLRKDGSLYHCRPCREAFMPGELVRGWCGASPAPVAVQLGMFGAPPAASCGCPDCDATGGICDCPAVFADPAQAVLL